jgi:hypothetical protein
MTSSETIYDVPITNSVPSKNHIEAHPFPPVLHHLLQHFQNLNEIGSILSIPLRSDLFVHKINRPLIKEDEQKVITAMG